MSCGRILVNIDRGGENFTSSLLRRQEPSDFCPRSEVAHSTESRWAPAFAGATH